MKGETDRDKAWDLLVSLIDYDESSEFILEYLIGNYFSGSEALKALEDYAEEVQFTSNS